MTIKLRLPWLSKITSYRTIPNEVPVFFNNHPEQVLGTCQIHQDRNGEYTGILELVNEIDENLYLYCMSSASEAKKGVFNLENINLAERLRRDNDTARVKELIIA